MALLVVEDAEIGVGAHLDDRSLTQIAA